MLTNKLKCLHLLLVRLENSCQEQILKMWLIKILIVEIKLIANIDCLCLKIL